MWTLLWDGRWEEVGIVKTFPGVIDRKLAFDLMEMLNWTKKRAIHNFLPNAPVSFAVKQSEPYDSVNAFHHLVQNLCKIA